MKSYCRTVLFLGLSCVAWSSHAAPYAIKGISWGMMPQEMVDYAIEVLELRCWWNYYWQEERIVEIKRYADIQGAEESVVYSVICGQDVEYDATVKKFRGEGSIAIEFTLNANAVIFSCDYLRSCELTPLEWAQFLVDNTNIESMTFAPVGIFGAEGYNGRAEEGELIVTGMPGRYIRGFNSLLIERGAYGSQGPSLN